MIMERKIGEIFEYKGEWYQCVKGACCNDCDLLENGSCINEYSFNSSCFSQHRKDETHVIFKKLEKVGEPIKVNGKVVQTLRLHTSKCECADCCFYKDKETGACYKDSPCRPYEIFVEIKQNQEDIEEKKLNLKPFDLEAARKGKPVCTRDGREARIICFDSLSDDDKHPIIALVENKEGYEDIHRFTDNGKRLVTENDARDLMMLPEKKEGWVNIDKGGSGKITISSPYSTKEEAIHNDNETTIDTIKISWEE